MTQSSEEATPILRLQGVTKRFGGLTAVNNVSLDVRAGIATSLVGPNGAGKTTVFNLICGAIKLDAGRVAFEGRDITRRPPSVVARLGISRTFQDVRLFASMTVLENVLVSFQRQRGEFPPNLLLRPLGVSRQEKALVEKAEDILERIGLQGSRNMRSSDLSYAQQKLLIVARAIAMDSPLWLLDEPASGLDPAGVSELSSRIRALVEQGQTVMLVEHNLDMVRAVSDWVVFLSGGQVTAQGTSAQIFSDQDLLRLYVGGGVA